MGYSFRPWDGEKSIADGDSILQYIKDTARESGVDAHIRFNHRITAADWSTPDSLWHITAERTDTDETDRGHGLLPLLLQRLLPLRPRLPARLRGHVRLRRHHRAPAGLARRPRLAGKRVVVIGSGATAVTLVPALARSAAHVTMLQRSPTYIASLPEKSPVVAMLRKVLPPKQAGTAAKWFHAILTQAFYQVSRKYPKLVRRMLSKGLERQLPSGYDIATHFTPRYDPWDQRFCAVPNGDLFKALSTGAASVVTDQIERFTEKGLLLASGDETRGRHHRHRHRTRTALPGRHRAQRGRGACRSCDPAHLQGDDDRGRAEPGTGHRLHQRVLDAEVRPHVRLRVPSAEPHARTRALTECVAREPGRLRCLGPDSRADLGVHPALGPPAAEARDEAPLEGPPELPARLPCPEDERHRRLRHGVLGFVDARRGPSSPSLVRLTRRQTMKEFSGRVAAITGAGSGIGRALANALARRGAHLALSDIDDTGLAETVAQCEGFGVKITSRASGRGRSGCRLRLGRAASSPITAGSTSIVNNAGVALGATVESMSYEDFEWLMNINFWGVVYGTKAFLPHLKQSGEGHIVNLSSVFGLISVPSQSAYNAAKFAVRGFTDTLRMELEIEGANVSVTTIHPGGIKTNIARNARMDASVRDVAGDPEKAVRDFERAFITSPEKAADADPHRRPPRPAARAHRPGRQGDRFRLATAGDHLPVSPDAGAPAPSVADAFAAGAHAGTAARPPNPLSAVPMASRQRRSTDSVEVPRRPAASANAMPCISATRTWATSVSSPRRRPASMHRRTRPTIRTPDRTRRRQLFRSGREIREGTREHDLGQFPVGPDEPAVRSGQGPQIG